MFKDNLHLKFIRYFYDIADDLDEYRENQLNKFGNVMFIFLFFTIWLTYILTAFGIDISYYTSLLMMIVPLLAIGIRVQTLQLDRIEVEKKDLGTARWRC